METTQEHANWGYLWSQMQWKHRYIAVGPGELQVFGSQHRDHHSERTLFLNSEVSVKIVDSASHISKSNFWHKLTGRSSSSCVNQNFFEPVGAIVNVTSSDGKRLLLLTSSLNEAETWKAEIEKATRAVEKPVQKKQQKSTRRLLLRLLSRKTAALKQETEKNGCQRRLRWETACSRSSQKDVESIGLETLQECTEFLKLQSSDCEPAFQVTANMVTRFNGLYQMGDYFLSNELRVEAWKGTLLTMARMLRDELVGGPAYAPFEEQTSERLWLACETWVMAGVHDKIMGACEQMFAADDRELSRVQSKLRQVDPSLLGVNADIKHAAFGEAIQIFGTINSYRTPLEKAVCLRKTVHAVLEGIRLQREQDELPCTDDLLSLMLLLMAHSKVHHLKATAFYMENFLHIREQENNSGELRYHITNFAAACAYLSSPEIKHLVCDINISQGPSSAFSSPNSSTSSSSRSDFLKFLDSSSELNSSSRTSAAFTTHSSPEFILAPTYL